MPGDNLESMLINSHRGERNTRIAKKILAPAGFLGGAVIEVGGILHDQNLPAMAGGAALMMANVGLFLLNRQSERSWQERANDISTLLPYEADFSCPPPDGSQE